MQEFSHAVHISEAVQVITTYPDKPRMINLSPSSLLILCLRKIMEQEVTYHCSTPQGASA